MPEPAEHGALTRESKLSNCANKLLCIHIWNTVYCSCGCIQLFEKLEAVDFMLFLLQCPYRLFSKNNIRPNKKIWFLYKILLPFSYRVLQTIIGRGGGKNPTKRTQKNTCEFKATELREVVPTFPPLYIICIQGF